MLVSCPGNELIVFLATNFGLSREIETNELVFFVCFFAFVSCLLQVKLEPRSPAKPSRVVHIRNIPNDVTEAEIVHLGIPFGRVTNVLVLKGKNQVRFLFYLILCPLRKPYFPSRSFAVWPDRAALVAC